MRIIAKGVFFLALFICVERFCHKQTKGFSQSKIRSTLSYDPRFASPTPSPEQIEDIKEILSQPFYYMKCGGETYVFISADRNWVIKFFKHQHMRHSTVFDPLLPAFWIKKRREKFHTFFTSCKLAEERFSKETGLVFLHLNKTNFLHQTLKIFDPIGVVHMLPLDQMEFVVQKKATLAYPTISYLADTKEYEAIQTRIGSYIELIAKRSAQGLAETDARKRNFGFINSQAIEIDLGSLRANESLKDPKNAKRALLFEVNRLRQWIQKNHPELLEVVDKAVEQQLEKTV